jgi:ubiquinone/menaquinone biosynthesis C-methylase UbiE
MHHLLLSLLLFICLPAMAQDRYTYKGDDPNGIRKSYMGRQIAQVMSHWGIDWLERPERDFEENTTQLIRNLDIKSGMTVADIGAGSGYHSRLLSKKVSNGRVYAVDVAPEMIEFLENRIQKEKISNIIPILGTEKSVNLPAASTDLMLLVDVYHEFSFPYEMARSMHTALKPNGKLVLVEFRKEDDSVPIKMIHKMSEEQAVKEMKAAGFKLEKNISNLPWQHCMIFIKD